MRRRQKTLYRWVRSVAAVTLLIWLAAQALCAAHCSMGVKHSDSRRASCHGSVLPQAQHQHDNSSGQTEHGSNPGLTCLVLKSALLSSDPLAPDQPELDFPDPQSRPAVALDAALRAPAPPIFRQAWRGDWVFRPEVSLGPALRSHAPPVFL